MKKLVTFISLALIICLTACDSDVQTSENIGLTPDSKTQTEAESSDDFISSIDEDEQEYTSLSSTEETDKTEEITDMKMNVQIGNSTFTATLENNAAVRELIEMMKESPITIEMSDYSGFEKVGPLGRSLTTDNKQTTTAAGDIVLYSGNQIVMFYGSNSWSYTRIGKIDDLSGWESALGSGSITAVFSLAE
ncbi:MAG: hypothetical protein J1E39_00230 [Eubacterium sp.]|nr:hypothetical protein [Eubacterium sp.]